MGKLYWFGVATVLGLGLFAAWYVADQRQNETLLEPQSFESYKQIQSSLLPFLDLTHGNRKWFFIGLEPQNSQQLAAAESLIEQLSGQQTVFLVVDPYFEKVLQPKPDLSLSLLQSREDFVQRIRSSSGDQLVVILVPNVLVSQIVSESFFFEERIQSQLPQYAILTLTSFPSNLKDEDHFFLPCSESQQIRTGLSELGCYIRSQVRSRYSLFENLKSPFGFLLRLNDRELVFFLK